jgi:hypothetical protein
MALETPTIAWVDLYTQLAPESAAWLQENAGQVVYYYRRDLGWVRVDVPTD